MNLRRITLGLFACTALLGAAGASGETTLDLNLNSDAARLSFMTPITPTGLYVNGAYLYSNERGDVINAGLHLIGDAGVGPNPLRAGLGGQLYYVNPDIVTGVAVPVEPNAGGVLDTQNADGGFALGIGGFVKYQLPVYNRIGLGAHVYYAPDIIAFSGLDGLVEYGVRASYQVLRDASVYIGYRQIKADFGGDYYNLDSGFHAGLQLRF